MYSVSIIAIQKADNDSQAAPCFGRLQCVAPHGWITNLSDLLPRHIQLLIF